MLIKVYTDFITRQEKSQEKICRSLKTIYVRGTGGMFTKVSAAAMANEKGIPCCVMSGATPANLYRLFDGEQIGTIFGTK